MTSDEDDFHFRVTPQDWSDARDLEATILEITEPGDVIVSFDGDRVEDVEDLQQKVIETRPGTVVELKAAHPPTSPSSRRKPF